MRFLTEIKWFRIIDEWLNSITMYRLVLVGLAATAGWAIGLAGLGWLTYSGLALLVSLAVIVVVCFFSNLILAKIWRVPVNAESSLITALILFLIIFPSLALENLLILAVAGVIAMAAKYLLAIRGKHIFNPAAFGAVILGLLGWGNVWWWVGSAMMFPIVLIFCLLVVRKVRRFKMFTVFILAGGVTTFLVQLNLGLPTGDILRQLFLSSPLIFLGGIMLTEPLTTPPGKKGQIVYGLLVGALFGWPWHWGFIYSSPEMALIIGNVFAYGLSFKRRVMMFFQDKREIAKDVWEFEFKPDKPFVFMPGQYMEWTTGQRRIDNRGNRRYFTIASAPTEGNILLGVKFNKPGSEFKKYLAEMPLGEVLAAGCLMGNFLLPEDKKEKLVFIAGGIGVTPFRSMIKYLIDKEERREVVLFYNVKSEAEIAYRDIWREAENKLGLKTVCIISDKEGVPDDWEGEVGFMDKAMIKKYVDDWGGRRFYLSGPEAMVKAYKKMIKGLGVKRDKIMTDYFPGF